MLKRNGLRISMALLAAALLILGVAGASLAQE
jgi:hypothetical protein